MKRGPSSVSKGRSKRTNAADKVRQPLADHPARTIPGRVRPQRTSRRVVIPRVGTAEIDFRGRTVHLTNLGKPFWPELGITKADLLRYYADVAAVLLPHIRDRAMVMKRYPNGAAGPFFFMKHAPVPRPDWIDICSISHDSGNIVDFPVIQDLPSLLWVVNLGCIDLNQWYARCDDVDRPDYLHFDLDPGPQVEFETVRAVALHLKKHLDGLEMPTYIKTTGSRGLHVYIPIVRGPSQKQVWTIAKQIAVELAIAHPEIITAEYRIAKRPAGRVLVDYNQNAWGRTLASVYSVRPKSLATVSMPVTWNEIKRGVRIEDFHLKNAVQRIRRVGDLWKPLLAARGRFHLEKLL
jgi:bifunctional non-homologous end joining protein LigD